MSKRISAADDRRHEISPLCTFVNGYLNFFEGRENKICMKPYCEEIVPTHYGFELNKPVFWFLQGFTSIITHRMSIWRTETQLFLVAFESALLVSLVASCLELDLANKKPSEIRRASCSPFLSPATSFYSICLLVGNVRLLYEMY